MVQGMACLHVRNALETVRQAIQIFGSSDLPGLERAIGLLEAAADQMHQAEAAVRSADGNHAAELRRETVELKSQVACAMRVIDGCAALHRGLAIRLRGANLSYTAQGYAVAASHSRSACETQG